MRPLQLILPIVCAGLVLLGGASSAGAKSLHKEHHGNSKVLEPLSHATEDPSDCYTFRLDDDQEASEQSGCSEAQASKDNGHGSKNHGDHGPNGNLGGGGSCHPDEEEGNGPPSTPNEVPEPATAILLGFGILGAIALQRKSG